jgi:hypothetical protein
MGYLNLGLKKMNVTLTQLHAEYKSAKLETLVAQASELNGAKSSAITRFSWLIGAFLSANEVNGFDLIQSEFKALGKGPRSKAKAAYNILKHEIEALKAFRVAEATCPIALLEAEAITLESVIESKSPSTVVRWNDQRLKAQAEAQASAEAEAEAEAELNGLIYNGGVTIAQAKAIQTSTRQLKALTALMMPLVESYGSNLISTALTSIVEAEAQAEAQVKAQAEAQALIEAEALAEAQALIEAEAQASASRLARSKAKAEAEASLRQAKALTHKAKRLANNAKTNAEIVSARKAEAISAVALKEAIASEQSFTIALDKGAKWNQVKMA